MIWYEILLEEPSQAVPLRPPLYFPMNHSFFSPIRVPEYLISRLIPHGAVDAINIFTAPPDCAPSMTRITFQSLLRGSQVGEGKLYNLALQFGRCCQVNSQPLQSSETQLGVPWANVVNRDCPDSAREGPIYHQCPADHIRSWPNWKQAFHIGFPSDNRDVLCELTFANSGDRSTYVYPRAAPLALAAPQSYSYYFSPPQPLYVYPSPTTQPIDLRRSMARSRSSASSSNRSPTSSPPGRLLPPDSNHSTASPPTISRPPSSFRTIPSLTGIMTRAPSSEFSPASPFSPQALRTNTSVSPAPNYLSYIPSPSVHPYAASIHSNRDSVVATPGNSFHIPRLTLNSIRFLQRDLGTAYCRTTDRNAKGTPSTRTRAERSDDNYEELKPERGEGVDWDSSSSSSPVTLDRSSTQPLPMMTVPLQISSRTPSPMPVYMLQQPTYSYDVRAPSR